MAKKRRGLGIEKLAAALDRMGGGERLDPVKALTDEKIAIYPGVAPESIEIMRHMQAMRERQNYTPAPRIEIKEKTQPTSLEWWDYVELDKSEAADPNRLTHYFKQWTTPVSSYGTGENRIPYHIFFAILAENGVPKAEFDWKSFRETYFSINPDKRGAFAEHRREFRESAKGKDAKRAYDRQRKAARRKELRDRKRRGGMF